MTAEVVIHFKQKHVVNNSMTALIVNSLIHCRLESVCTLHHAARVCEPHRARFCAIFISQKQLSNKLFRHANGEHAT